VEQNLAILIPTLSTLSTFEKVEQNLAILIPTFTTFSVEFCSTFSKVDKLK
jgi:hypothetical protein